MDIVQNNVVDELNFYKLCQLTQTIIRREENNGVSVKL